MKNLVMTRVLAPTASPCLEQRAWGMISPNTTIPRVEPMTAMRPVICQLWLVESCIILSCDWLNLFTIDRWLVMMCDVLEYAALIGQYLLLQWECPAWWWECCWPEHCPAAESRGGSCPWLWLGLSPWRPPAPAPTLSWSESAVQSDPEPSTWRGGYQIKSRLI